MICCRLAGDGGSGTLAAAPGDNGVPDGNGFLDSDQPRSGAADADILTVSSKSWLPLLLDLSCTLRSELLYIGSAVAPL